MHITELLFQLIGLRVQLYDYSSEAIHVWSLGHGGTDGMNLLKCMNVCVAPLTTVCVIHSTDKSMPMES